jgi:integrase
MIFHHSARGTVYVRYGKLMVDFRYMNQRVREPVGLPDTPENRRIIRRKLDLVMAEIDSGEFEFAKRFPYSRKKELFSIMETGTYQKDPSDVTFGEYFEKWFSDMKTGMSESKIRDYQSTVHHHLLPYFAEIPFSAFTPVLMKKFQAHLKGKKTPGGKPLSNKRIQNIFIPLRMITADAFIKYGFNLPNPFVGLKLPNSRKFRVTPFNYEEWSTLLTFIPEWYRPYFEFAVNTGLRPSEQVALKWSAVEEDFFSLELSRVRNREKEDLKTESSYRQIAITSMIRDILNR